MKLGLLLVAFGSLGATTISAQQPPRYTLDDALSMIFDSNKDGLITISEVSETINMVAMMAGDSELTPGASDEMVETRNMVDSAIAAAPAIFEFLDGDSSDTLTRKELKWISNVQSGFLSGAMRSLIREVYAAIDTNDDDFLDASELDILAGKTNDDGQVLTTIAELMHTAYPVRKDAEDLKSILQKGISALGANGYSTSDEMSYIDTNKDGKIDKKEAVKVYLDMKKIFLSAAKTCVQMAPMAAMMGGMDGGGGGGGMNMEL